MMQHQPVPEPEYETTLAAHVEWAEGPRSAAWEKLWRRILCEISLVVDDQSSASAPEKLEEITRPVSHHRD